MNTFLPRFLCESFFCTRKEENAELNAKNDYGSLRAFTRPTTFRRNVTCSTKLDADNLERKRLDVNGRVFHNARLSRRRLLVCTWNLYRDKNLFAFSLRRSSVYSFFLFFLFTRMYANALSVLRLRAALHARLTLLDIMRARYRSSASNFHFCMRDRRDDTYVRTYICTWGLLCRRSPFRITPRSRFTERRNAAANYARDVTRRTISFRERPT